MGTAVGLLVLVPLSPLPTDWVSFFVLALAGLLLERHSVTMDGEARFTPAASVYLAMGMIGSVGSSLVGVLLLFEAGVRRGTNVLKGLESRFPTFVGLLTMALTSKVATGLPWLAPPLLGAPAFFFCTLALERASRAQLSPKERVHWLRARVQIRPLYFVLAVSAWAVAALSLQQPWLPLVLLPVLGSTGVAAENVILKARAASTDQVLHALADARGQKRQAVKKLAQAQTEKQLMEGFSAHLARAPGLQSTSQALVATVDQFVEADDVVIFLSPDLNKDAFPDPFFYRADHEHQARLQGIAFTHLIEPVVVECWKTRSVKYFQDTHPSGERLFRNNLVAVAMPLANLGVLYAGRREATPFEVGEIQRLKWLSDKARLAYESAFRDHERERKQAQTRQQVDQLRQRVELLGNLIRSAEEMASTLLLEELADRLSTLLKDTLPHSQGMLIFQWDGGLPVKRAWGGTAPPTDLSMLEAVEKSGKPLLVKDLTGSPFTAPSPGLLSVIASPLFAHGKTCGVVALGALEKAAFGEEHLDQLRLIAYQAGMAFSNARLYRQVEDARQQLIDSQESLIQSSKMSAIGKLAAGVAHELNTPLGVMNLALEQALEMFEERPEIAHRMVTKAMTAIERSRTITDRLLAYSRKPSGEEGLISLEQVIGDTLSFLSYELRKAKIEPQLKVTDFAVVGRSQELQQVLMNLISNALYSMEELPAEKRFLGITLREIGKEIVLDVVDGGCGMSPEQVSQVFEPFFTTKPVGKGTGLGLWVSLQIMEQHKGRIEVESQLGRGSRFRMIFPMGPDSRLEL